MSALIFLHSILRYVILILILLAIGRHMSAMGSKRLVNNGDKKIDLFLLISAHTTLLIGLILYFAGDVGFSLFKDAPFSEIMKNKTARFFALEHPTGMIISVILITIGRGKVKRAVDASAHKKAFWFFLIALILILASIPWPFRAELGRPWLPGM